MDQSAVLPGALASGAGPRRAGCRARRSAEPGAAAPVTSAPMIPAPMTSAAADAIVIEGLCMRYGTTSALEDVTLAVRQHETFGLIGRHGAGKTSLLKSILMLVTPQAGASASSANRITCPAAARASPTFRSASSRRATSPATISSA